MDRAERPTGPDSSADADRAHAPLSLELSEPLLDDMLHRWWQGADVAREVRFSLGNLGQLAGSASARAACPRLALVAAEGGALRFACEARLRLEFGLMGGRRDLTLRWIAIARPSLERAQPTAPPRLVADLADARIEDLRVESTDRFLGWEVDRSALDPFSRWRSEELGRLGVRQLLTRIGELRLPLPIEPVEALIEAAGHRPEDLALAIGDGRARLAFDPGASEVDGPPPQVLVGGDATEDAPDAARASSVARLSVGAAALERLIERSIERRWPGVRVDRLALSVAPHRVAARLEVRPATGAWPGFVALHLDGRFAIVEKPEQLGLALESLHLIRPRLPARAEAWLTDRVRDRLPPIERTRRLEVGSIVGPLRIDRIAWAPRGERLVIDASRVDA